MAGHGVRYQGATRETMTGAEGGNSGSTGALANRRCSGDSVTDNDGCKQDAIRVCSAILGCWKREVTRLLSCPWGWGGTYLESRGLCVLGRMRRLMFVLVLEIVSGVNVDRVMC